MVLGEGDSLLPTMLTPQGDLKFIIVVPDEEMIPDVKLPDAPCMFATVTYDGERKPTVRFIRPEGGEYGWRYQMDKDPSQEIVQISW